MDKKDFEILMNSLYNNNQLFIPQGQTINEWIDNVFIENKIKLNSKEHQAKLLSEIMQGDEELGLYKVNKNG